MINIILCGGSGTRLWPLSRTMLPKQFVRLFEERSLFQDTVLRNQTVCEQFFIVSNQEQFFLAIDQLSQISDQPTQFLLESVGRNTAPAIALACLALDKDEVVLVTTSDHLVKDQAAYEEAVQKAKIFALQDYLVTFGIKPDYAETGFGYIEASGNEVLSFKEKPSKKVAQSYVDAGNYYWNSGMFCFKAGIFLEELEKCSFDLFQACVNAFQKTENSACPSEIRIDLEGMMAIPEDSIDYAVMEQSDKVKVVPCSMGWSDLGSFDALYDEVKSDVTENAILKYVDGAPDPITVDAKNNLVLMQDRQIALIDVNDLLIVDTADALLISKKGSSQKVKDAVAQIKRVAPELAHIHRLVYRPWGTYEVLLDTEQYKIKRIVVKPGNKLSLQKHFHRNEHWIVVSGTASVLVGDAQFLVRPNESTYIQMGDIHRLENDGKIDLVMIEVQVGEYTGEDDIVRIEDVYGR
jgi:mannose-1-phosphate guanylyltransferase